MRPSASVAVKALDDDQIMEIIKEVAPWKHEPKLNDLLTYEKSPPLFPQATYDVPSYRAVNFVRAVEKRLPALSNPPAQPGWRMVPEEPTEEMRDDAWNTLNSRGLRHFGMSDILAIWKAMLTTAPLPGCAK